MQIHVKSEQKNSNKSAYRSNFAKAFQITEAKNDNFFKNERKCKIVYCFYFIMCYNRDIHNE